MTESKYDKIAALLMETTTPTITLTFEEVQGLLREYRELHLVVEEMGVEPKTAVERYKARRAAGQPYTEAKNAVLMENQVTMAKKALAAALLFHNGQPWDKAASSEWFKLTGSYEATTKVLCDTVRRALLLTSSPADRRTLRAGEVPSIRAKASDAEMAACLENMLRVFAGGSTTSDDHGAWVTECMEVVEQARGLLVRRQATQPKPWTTQDTIREIRRVQDRRDEVRRKLDAGEITREEARREFPESY